MVEAIALVALVFAIGFSIVVGVIAYQIYKEEQDNGMDSK